jgi:hypothetical protein
MTALKREVYSENQDQICVTITSKHIFTSKHVFQFPSTVSISRAELQSSLMKHERNINPSLLVCKMVLAEEVSYLLATSRPPTTARHVQTPCPRVPPIVTHTASLDAACERAHTSIIPRPCYAPCKACVDNKSESLTGKWVIDREVSH